MAAPALFESVVEGLAALISRHREPRHGSVALPAGDEPPPAREVGLSQELPHSARLRVLPARHRSRDPRGRRTRSRPAATGPRICRRPTWCSARPPAIRSIRWSRAAARCRRRGLCSTWPATVSATSRRAISTGSKRSACANMSASARRSRSTEFRERWMTRAQGIADRLGPALSHRAGQRPVLRPRRQADGEQPDRAGAEVRTAGAGALRRAADRLHELQLSPRTFRQDLGAARTTAGEVRIPAASPSAWTGWRWRCLRPTALKRLTGRNRLAKRWRRDPI